MEELAQWTHLVPGVVRIPITAFKYRHILQKYFKKLQVFAGSGKTNILITGLPSAGKTLLSSALANEINTLNWQRPGRSRNVETKTIVVGEWAKIVRVIPGQGISERERGLHEALDMHDKLEGIIHVVDWGFHKTRDGVVEQKLISDGVNSIAKLREFNLKNERDEFQYVCTRIKAAHSRGLGPKWLIIAANKCDLYKDQLQDAQEYYHPAVKSDFTDILNDLLHVVGKANLQVISLPVCSDEEDFTWGKEVILTRVGGADNKSALLRIFLTQLAALG